MDDYPRIPMTWEDYKEWFRKRMKNRRPRLRKVGVWESKNKLRAAIEFYMEGTTCEICGYPWIKGIFHFHHVSKEGKVNCISKLTNNGSSHLLWEELNKCISVCPTCHSLLHARLVVYNSETP